MNYDDFMLTLRDLLGFKLTGDPPTFDEMIATLQRDNSKSDEIHTQLCAAVDDLLAEAGYDTLFDTREKCLEALRQDIKARLGTAPVDRETLAKALGAAIYTEKWNMLSAESQRNMAVAADTALRLIRPAPAAKVVDQEGLAKLLYNPHGGAAVAWEHKSEAARSHFRDMAAAALKHIGAASTADETQSRNLLADEALRLRAQLADAQQQVGLWRDTAETQKKMRLDLAVEQDKLVAALDEAQNQLAAERKKWPELKAEVERTRALVRARGLTISLFEKIALGHADPGAVLRDTETGETAHISPDVRAALKRQRADIEQMARTNFDLRRELTRIAETTSVAIHKPIDRDRIRLALLDHELFREEGAIAINHLADHLLKRLA